MWQSKMGDFLITQDKPQTGDEEVNINIGPENNFSPSVEVVTEADIHTEPPNDASAGTLQQPRGASVDAGMPHTAAAQGDVAYYGADWQSPPQMMVDLIHQQQQMMERMAALLPQKRAGDSDVQQNTDTPAKKSKVAVDLATQKFAKAELVASDQGDDTGDLEQKLADLIDEDEQQHEEDDPGKFDSLNEFFDKQEKTSKAVAEATAAVINTAMRASVPSSREKDLLDRVLRPDNCPALSVPKVNPEIWREMKKATRDSDVSLQKIQQCLLKGIMPLVHVMDSLRSSKDREALSQLGDTFKLLALASTHLSTKRKELIAPDLAFQYKQLCSANKPVTQLLFGDELQKNLRDIKEAQSVGVKLASPPHRGDYRGRARYSPAGRGYQQINNNNNRGQGHGRGRFLSRGGYGQRRRGNFKAQQPKETTISPAPK